MKWRRLIGGGKLVLEGRLLRAILIREGRSLNGNVWTRPILEQIAKLANGRPVNLYDFSAQANERHLSHWEFIRRRLPPAIARMLPERLGDAQVATIKNATVEGPDGEAKVIADLEVAPGKEGLIDRVLEAARRIGKTVGLSIHVPEDGLAGRDLDNGDFEPTEVKGIVGFDTVSIPSAGGRILPVLEALARRTPMKGWIKRLLRLVPEKKRPALEALLKALPEEGAKIESAEELLVDDHKELTKGLVEALELDDVGDEALGACLEALVRTAPKDKAPAKKKTAKKKTAHRRTRRAAPVLEDVDDDDDDLDDTDDDPDPLRDDVDLLLLDGGRDTIEAVLEAAKLPGELPDFARKQLTARLESAGRMSRTDAKSFVEELKKSLGKSQAVGGGLLEGTPDATPIYSQEWSDGERAECALEALIAREQFGELVDDKGKKTKVPAFTGIRQAYGVITGDVMCEGMGFLLRSKRPSSILESYDWEQNKYMQMYLKKTGIGLEAAVTSTGFADILTNIINKRLTKEYAQLPHVWKMVARTESVNDFKSREIHRLGEYANLLDVAEAGPYLDLGLPTEETVAAVIAKHGGLAPITWESIVNDDTRVFRGIPGKLARSADRTLNVAVWAKLLANANWDEDAVAFFHVSAWPTGHANLTAAAYSFAQLEAARLAMTKQKDPDEREMGVVKAKNVFCGPALYDQIWTDLFSDRRPVLTEVGEIGTAASGDRALDLQNPAVPNWARQRESWTLTEVHEFEETTGSESDVIVAADIGVAEIMEVGFLNGNESPEIFIQDMERVGSFFDSDTITYKVRHVHDSGELVDPRGAHLIQAP